MNAGSVPPFGEWYAAIHADRKPGHRAPFPWQSRLAESVDIDGRWPSTIKVPTGLGKTACLDIAVWALARQADRPPEDRTARTRIWWVVNRRLLVDDTYSHVQGLHQMLRDAEPGTAVGRVATALRRIAGSEDAEPLEVRRLRGGEPKTRPSLPSQPAVICSTVPMYGSRLLFRGYGTSRSMLPIDAALAGTDSLVLLDEAHLANGLRHLISSVNIIQSAAAEHITGRCLSIVPVAITATADSSVFDIDADDEQHPEVSKRLNATKRLSLYTGKSWDAKPTAGASNQTEPSAGTANIAKDIVAATKALLDQLDTDGVRPRTVLVFVNSPRTAMQVHQSLASWTDCEIRVLTGTTRGLEATAITKDVRIWMASGRSDTTAGPPTPATRIVVATQTLEVGADLDADHMVTESCGVQSLVQRLGRLNRTGDRNDSRVCFVHDPVSKERPIYGTDPAEIWKMLKQSSQPDGSTRKGIENTTLDLSPATLRDSASAVLPPAPLAAKPLDYAVLHDAVLRDLAQTSCPTYEPPAEVFFEGTQEPDRELELIWRAYVPDSQDQWGGDLQERLWPPQSADEALSVPVWVARETLQRLHSADRGKLFRVEPDRTLSPVTWRGGEPVLRPGQTLVLPASAGMLSEHGMLDPENRAPVVDAAIAKAESGLPLDK
ncbi:MAG: type I-U CRISPR-associated helicase/endonuclease Cas3, partial [Acidimicrobiaceae bacterium]|nr:type I-U CRISPR-associated helicase/endonuclease Cas3 [Acidimicrobiaceae bacterium]